MRIEIGESELFAKPSQVTNGHIQVSYIGKKEVLQQVLRSDEDV